jgi:hypothetical protein
MQKKVAFAPCFFNSSSTQGVMVACGPSSKVRYTSLFVPLKLQVNGEKILFKIQGVLIKYFRIRFKVKQANFTRPTQSAP